MQRSLWSLIFIFIFNFAAFAAEQKVFLGVDRVFDAPFAELLKGKNIGLITNHTGVNRHLVSTIQLFYQNQEKLGFTLKALFAPEHGLFGEGYAGEAVISTKTREGIPIHSLHGKTRRPTEAMLQGIDLLVFDIQDIGCRSYTFASTLYYAMEEAAKKKIAVLVLDRPNPINGVTIDGPMLEKEVRSFIGYINVPYCHGMTIGELSQFFNSEYKIGCTLSVVPMKGWRRKMSFSDTGLSWIPTSPNIPEATTCYSYPATGFLGELSLAAIGIGYTLPFKVVAAPWIDEKKFAKELNRTGPPGVTFTPIQLKPFMGSFSGKVCKGAFIVITDRSLFLPVTAQYHILATLKKLYPNECAKTIKAADINKKELFIKACGTKAIYDFLLNEKATLQQLRDIHRAEREQFLPLRKKYLLPDYE